MEQATKEQYKACFIHNNKTHNRQKEYIFLYIREKITKHDLRMQGENKDHNENELQTVNKNQKTQPRKEKP